MVPFDNLLGNIHEFSAEDVRQAADAVWALAKMTSSADIRQLLLHVASDLHQEALTKDLAKSDDSDFRLPAEPTHGPMLKVGSRVMDKHSMEEGIVRKLEVLIEWNALHNKHLEMRDMADLVLLDDERGA